MRVCFLHAWPRTVATAAAPARLAVALTLPLSSPSPPPLHPLRRLLAMAASAVSASSVPVRALQESEGHAITVELKSGELYRGHLDAAESTMNVVLSTVVHTGRDGRVTKCVPTPPHSLVQSRLLNHHLGSLALSPDHAPSQVGAGLPAGFADPLHCPP